jgi:hypothetical protein
MTHWGSSSLDLIRIQATVLETNSRSESVLVKCGYTYEGLLKSYRMVRGIPGDFKMYSYLAETKKMHQRSFFLYSRLFPHALLNFFPVLFTPDT